MVELRSKGKRLLMLNVILMPKSPVSLDEDWTWQLNVGEALN